MTAIETAPARLTCHVANQIGWLILDNPARFNALSQAMWESIPGCVAKLEGHADVRLIAIAGAGDKAFASGADISEFARVRADASTSRAYDALSGRAFSAIRQSAKPTVAAIRGICMGGGLGLAAACDIRLASDDSRFAVPAAKLGLAYPPADIADLVHLIGPSRTKYLVYSGRTIGAFEALTFGLIDNMLPAGSFDDALAAELQTMAGLAPLTQLATKRAVQACLNDDPTSNTAAIEAAEACFDSLDYAEGRKAFLERRVARFVGR